VYHLNNQPLFSGLFAVSKEEMSGDWEVCRLIMNMVPVKRLCRSMGGDISTLPSWAGMSPFVLEDSEVLLMSSEDIRCFFYLSSSMASLHVFWKTCTFVNCTKRGVSAILLGGTSFADGIFE
jgi:hypothetical protein